LYKLTNRIGNTGVICEVEKHKANYGFYPDTCCELYNPDLADSHPES